MTKIKGKIPYCKHHSQHKPGNNLQIILWVNGRAARIWDKINQLTWGHSPPNFSSYIWELANAARARLLSATTEDILIPAKTSNPTIWKTATRLKAIESIRPIYRRADLCPSWKTARRLIKKIQSRLRTKSLQVPQQTCWLLIVRSKVHAITVAIWRMPSRPSTKRQVTGNQAAWPVLRRRRTSKVCFCQTRVVNLLWLKSMKHKEKAYCRSLKS